MNSNRKFRLNRQSGVVLVRVRTPRGNRWISTGQTSLAKAAEICDAAMVDQLESAAAANILSGEVIGRLLAGRRVTCAEILDGWKAEAAERLAPDTLAGYKGTLRAFLTEAGWMGLTITGIHRSTLNGWVNYMRVPVATRKARLAAIRSFYAYASASGYCVGNPASLILVKTRDLLFDEIEPKETIPITEAEYRMLMNSAEVSPEWRHATALSYWLGLRLKDVACLEWASILEREVVVYPRKTGRRLALPLDDPLLGGGELAAVILEMREARLAAPSEFCFPAFRELALSTTARAGLSVRYQRILQRHGIQGKRFHSLRHAAAMRLKDAGRTIEEIGRVLGHAGTEVTRVYTEHRAAADAKKAEAQGCKTLG